VEAGGAETTKDSEKPAIARVPTRSSVDRPLTKMMREAVRKGKVSALSDKTVAEVLLNDLCVETRDLDRISP
jgi:hypothetical protein